LPEDTELLWCGTDLLACADQMEGRSWVTLIDAMLDTSRVGSVVVLGNEDELLGLEDRQWHVHHLSLTQVIHLGVERFEICVSLCHCQAAPSCLSGKAQQWGRKVAWNFSLRPLA
jgi:Ni,Fe-hydrogenase maturation factor